MLRRRLVGAASLCLAIVTFARPAAAFDPFEIQVYDGTSNDPGQAGLELHVNYNHAPTRTFTPPELSSNRLIHYTFEPSLGLTRSWEVGLYVQFASQGTSAYWGGYKLRSKLVTPDGWHPHVRLGFNIELSSIPRRFESDRYGGELRPIFAWEGKYLHITANPNIEFAASKAGLRAGPEFNPALGTYLRVPDIAEIGIEYYGSVGTVANATKFGSQEHYVFAATNILAVDGWELNAGLGVGLTGASDAFIGKVIFGHALGNLWGTSKPNVRFQQ